VTFDPTQFGFIELNDFRIGGVVPVYEYKNHPAVDGTKEFLRLNLYLTRDGNYVTIWYGLLEPLFAEAELTDGRLASVAKPADMDFIHSYNEDLFRGDIDSAETAKHIFKAYARRNRQDKQCQCTHAWCAAGSVILKSSGKE
jgi:hypothetical protein